MAVQSDVEQNERKKKSHLTMEMGCWTKFRYMLSCITTKPKVVTSESVKSSQQENPDEGKSSNCTNDDRPLSQHASASNSCSPETSSPPNIGENMKISSKLRKFSFNELKSATRNFRPENLLGEGGFGRVYKGWISLSRTTSAKPGTGLAVAVKMLNHDGAQGHKEWLTEVNFLGDLFHIHLVNLIGYCIEEDKRLLVYEFMPRGSLESHLFRSSLPLSWANRLKIALGAAKGLAYLHEETEKPVIYRDFKTSNILLDADYNAKLSDFGLAKDGPEGEKTHVSTRVMGTYGYAAPEYVMTGHLSSKSDVYSFGVVLLEMLTGRRSMDKKRPLTEHNLVEWARPQLANRRKILRMIDPQMEGLFSMKAAQKAAHLAALCINRDAKVRPTMSDVVGVLKPLLHLKDMASSSSHFQANHIPHFRSRSAARTSFRVQTGRVNACTGRSLSTPNGSCGSFHSLTGCRGSPGSIARQPSARES